jgi:hypothetical protein
MVNVGIVGFKENKSIFVAIFYFILYQNLTMRTLLLSLIVLTVCFFVSPTATYSQSKQALKEASSLFKTEAPKLCKLTDQFEKAKNTDAKIKSLDNFYVFFQGFMKQMQALNTKYPELGDIMDESSAMKAESEKFLECIGKFGMLISTIVETEQTDEKLIKAFEDFSKKMDALTATGSETNEN